MAKAVVYFEYTTRTKTSKKRASLLTSDHCASSVHSLTVKKMYWSAMKRKIVCLPQKVHVSEILLLIVSIILETTSSSFLYNAKKRCGGQCVLFAKLYERARILQGSSPSWCYLPMVFNFAATTTSVFVLKLIIKGRRYG